MRQQRFYGLLLAAALLPGFGCSDSTQEEDPRVIETPNNVNNANNQNNANNVNNANNANNVNNQNNVEPMLPSAGIDLIVDSNRDGVLDLAGDLDQIGEEAWSADSGAIFLPNIDDDDESCSLNLDALEAADCFDGADEVLDGPLDVEDLAPLVLRSINAAEASEALLTITKGAEHIRLFDPETLEQVSMPYSVTAEQLAGGVNLLVEGKDVARSTGWDGIVELTAELQWAEAPDNAELVDVVQMRVAPLLLRHHLDPATYVFSSELGVGGDGAFTNDLVAATNASGIANGHLELPVQDQWAQDYLETGYVAMPKEGGIHTIDVFIRSSNIEVDRFGRGYLREAGSVVYQLKGEDRAAMFAIDTDDHSLEWDTLNSFGNTETIPPHSYNGESYPVGRIIRGEAFGDRGDGGMRGLFEAQRIQNPLWVSTGWLLVGHIDETISFVPANNARGWVMLVNDARLATEILATANNNNGGGLTMFQDKAWIDFRGREVSAAVSLNEALNDPDIMSANAEAIVEVDDQVLSIKQATGLTDDEIVPVPFMHQDYNGSSTAYQPGMVNGLVPNASEFWAPDPHGPVVNGVDTMKAAFEERLAPFNIQIRWIEDWDMFHRLNGEVHCGSNVLRQHPTTGWWEDAQ